MRKSMTWCAAFRAAGSPPMDRSPLWRATRGGRVWSAMPCMSILIRIPSPATAVVNRLGETAKAFAFGGEDMQRQLLEQDGIEFDADGRVKLDAYIWRP